MELDDLKSAWRDLDRKLTTVLKLQAEHKLDRARGALRPLVWRLTWELLEGVSVVFLLGLYLAHNYHEARFAVPGVVLHFLAILFVVATVWQMVLARRIDYANPVVTIQQQLAELRAFRLRTQFAVLVLAPLLWVPVLIVVVKGLAAGDVYAGLGLPWVLANVAFGMAVVAAAVGVARRWEHRFRHSPFWGRLADDLAGRSLVRAREYVREAEEFSHP